MINSITKRLFIYVVIFAVILAGLIFAEYNYFHLLGDAPFMYVLLGAVGLILLYTVLIAYFSVSKPLSIVMKQVSYLLTGKSYKKILTDRKDEIGVLAYFFNEVTTNLSKVSNTLKESERMTEELSLAHKLQMDILPKQAPKIPGLIISAKTAVSTEVGGDNFDFLVFPKHSFIYLGDVTGHGTPAALVMAMAHAFLNAYSSTMDDPCKILINLNEELKKRIPPAVFMTLVMMKWDYEKKKMSYVGGGHEHIIVYRSATSRCEAIKTGGIAIGMLADNSKLVKEIEIPFEAGDFVVLYSDGITEARNMKGEMFGLARLQESINKYARQYSPDGVSYHTAVDLKGFMGDTIQADDMTIIAIQCTGDKKVEQTEESLETGWKG